MKFSICDWVTKNIFFYFIFCKKVKWVVYPRINCIWFLASIYLDPGFEPLISQRWVPRFYPISHRVGYILWLKCKRSYQVLQKSSKIRRFIFATINFFYKLFVSPSVNLWKKNQQIQSIYKLTKIFRQFVNWPIETGISQIA